MPDGNMLVLSSAGKTYIKRKLDENHLLIKGKDSGLLLKFWNCLFFKKPPEKSCLWISESLSEDSSTGFFKKEIDLSGCCLISLGRTRSCWRWARVSGCCWGHECWWVKAKLTCKPNWGKMCSSFSASFYSTMEPGSCFWCSQWFVVVAVFLTGIILCL